MNNNMQNNRGRRRRAFAALLLLISACSGPVKAIGQSSWQGSIDEWKIAYPPPIEALVWTGERPCISDPGGSIFVSPRSDYVLPTDLQGTCDVVRGTIIPNKVAAARKTSMLLSY